MSDIVKRTLRTFAQGAVGMFVLTALPLLRDITSSVLTDSSKPVVIDLSIWGNIGLACIAGGVIAAVALLQNWGEEKTGKALLPK